MRSVALHDRRPLPQFEHPIVGGANHDVEHGTGGAAVYLVCMVGGKSALRASDKKAKQQLVPGINLLLNIMHIWVLFSILIGIYISGHD